MPGNNRKTVLIIFLVAIMARIFFAICVYEPLSNSYFGNWKHPPGRFDWREDDKYDETARNLVYGRGFKIRGGTDNKLYPNLARPPVYPYVLAAQFYFLGEGFWPNLLINVSYQSVVSIVLFYIGLMMFNNRKAAIITALTWALYPLPMLQAMGPHSEAIYELILAFCVYFLYKYYKYNGNRNSLVLFSIFLVLLTLTRPITLLFPIYMGAIILYQKEKTIGKKIQDLLIVCLIFIIGIAPWMYRGYAITGEVIPLVTYKKPINYYKIKDTSVKDHKQIKFVERFNKEIKDPSRFAINYLVRLIEFWYYGHSTPVKLVNAAFQFPLLLLTILGLWRIRRDNILVAPLLIILFYFWFAYSAIHAISRYSFPLIIVLAPMTAIGILYLIEKIKKPEKIIQRMHNA
jgi:hypothetical protein